MAAERNSSTPLSYPQTRARLAQTLVSRYDRAGIIYRLRMVGYEASISDTSSNRSLAHKLAWALLPACVDRVKAGR